MTQLHLARQGNEVRVCDAGRLKGCFSMFGNTATPAKAALTHVPMGQNPGIHVQLSGSHARAGMHGHAKKSEMIISMVMHQW